MVSKARHILLMGFKHVGKSSIGRALSSCLKRPFYELDELTEGQYFQKTGLHKTCRQIVADEGEGFFSTIESAALSEALKQPAGVIALGGGTPMPDQNRPLICSQVPVHITAPQELVRTRVTAAGWPMAARFDEIWQIRDPVYRQLAQFTIENTGTIEDAVKLLVPVVKSNIG